MRMIFLAALACGLPAQELGLTLGRLTAGERLGAGTALQANYGQRIAGGAKAALFAEVHFLANSQRLVKLAGPALTRDVATLYVTPGVRVKFLPAARVSPYVAVGGGYALYEQSRLRFDGAPNGAPRTIGRGAFMFGGGADVKVWRFLSLRAEVRDFYTGSPAFNSAAIRGGQHNVVAGGGFVVNFGK